MAKALKSSQFPETLRSFSPQHLFSHSISWFYSKITKRLNGCNIGTFSCSITPKLSQIYESTSHNT